MSEFKLDFDFLKYILILHIFKWTKLTCIAIGAFLTFPLTKK
jgi:hypothetical protein